MRSVQKWLSCSPAVWWQEIRELTLLPILANNNNATRLLTTGTLSTQDKQGNNSVNKKFYYFCTGIGDRKSRSQKQRTRKGGMEKTCRNIGYNR